MIASLLNLDLLPLTLFFVLAGMLVHTLGVLVFNVYTTQDQLAGNNDLIQTKMPMFQKAVFLAMVFGVTISWLHYGNVNARIQQESTRLDLLVRVVGALPEADRVHILEAVAHYARTVARSDWPAMREGHRSQAAADALKDLAVATAAAVADSPRERTHLRFAGQLVRELAAAREARIESSIFPLAEGIRLFLYVMLGATLVFIWFAGLSSLFTKLMMGWFFIGLSMVALMYIHVLAHPLSGYAGMDAEPYLDAAERAVEAMGRSR
jgi:hypothetical protein